MTFKEVMTMYCELLNRGYTLEEIAKMPLTVGKK